MAKAKTETNTDAPKKEKAAAGSSIPAQAKQLVVALALEIKEGLASLSEQYLAKGEQFDLNDLLTDHTAEWLTNLSTEIATNAQRGLPLAVRLANVEKEITEHWTTLPIKDGKAVPTPEWQEKANALVVKKSNLLRAQKREADESQTVEAGKSATSA